MQTNFASVAATDVAFQPPDSCKQMARRQMCLLAHGALKEELQMFENLLNFAS